jgi:hypothetical protein
MVSREDDYLIDGRTTGNFARVPSISGEYLLQGIKVRCNHLTEWPVFPDLLIGRENAKCVGLALSANPNRLNYVKSALMIWHPSRYEIISPGGPQYQQLVGGLGTDLPYVLIWFKQKCHATAQLAQLGPEVFSWLVEVGTSKPVGVALHDFSETINEFDLELDAARSE